MSKKKKIVTNQMETTIMMRQMAIVLLPKSRQVLNSSERERNSEELKVRL
jgi:hypothetical protein